MIDGIVHKDAGFPDRVARLLGRVVAGLIEIDSVKAGLPARRRRSTTESFLPPDSAAIIPSLHASQRRLPGGGVMMRELSLSAPRAAGPGPMAATATEAAPAVRKRRRFRAVGGVFMDDLRDFPVEGRFQCTRGLDPDHGPIL